MLKLIVKNHKLSEDLKNAFRRVRNQSIDSNFEHKKRSNKKVSTGGRKASNADALQELFNKRVSEGKFDEFTPPDLVFYWEKVAKDCNINWQNASMSVNAGAMRNLLKHYSPRDIVNMIDFLFKSSQTYIDMYISNPTVLVSNYFMNRIYADSVNWKKGEFKNETEKKFANREYSRKSSKVETKIGSWE